MASSNGLAPLDLLPPPPSPPPSSLPPQSHSTTSLSAPSRPIPIEIYNHILHFAFGRHLPPVPLENRLDEPPSLSHLLPLTLVSKGLRELVLPYLYHHLTIRRDEDWTQLFDPEEGILVGEGEEATRRRRWVKKLSFARGGFPVASWTASKHQPAGTVDPRPEPNLAVLNFAGLGELEEVCIGNWGREEVEEEEIDAAADVEMRGGPYRDQTVKGGYGSTEQEIRERIEQNLEILRSMGQSTSVLDLLSETDPPLLRLSLVPFERHTRSSPALQSTKLIFHPPGCAGRSALEGEGNVLSTLLRLSTDCFPSSRFNVDLVLKAVSEETRKSLLASLGRWAKDEDGWWTVGVPLLREASWLS